MIGESAMARFIKRQKIILVHEKCVREARRFKESYLNLLQLLQEMDDLKGFREFGYKSLYDYCLRELKLSEDVSATLIQLARKSKALPVLQEKLVEEKIGISSARMIAPILTKDNQESWLKKAECLSRRELEREIKT